MTGPADEQAPLLRLAVEALRPYDIPTGRPWSDEDRAEPARAVLDALGLVRVGYWCDEHDLPCSLPTCSTHEGEHAPVYRADGNARSPEEADR